MPTYLSRILLASQSRPNVNGPTQNAHDYIGPDRKARPIKHWRKQLLPTGGSGSGGSSRSARGAPVSSMERPGVTVVKNQEDCCDPSGGGLYLSHEGIDFSGCTSLVPIQNNGHVQVGDPLLPNSYNIQTGIYNTATIACSPQNNIIKSAVTLLSKSYFSNNRAYLQSRNMRYDQKQTLSPISEIHYTTGSGANIEVLYPTDTNTGPQVFNTNTCPKAHGGRNCTITTIYKPNNRNFSVEGAVSSSTRLDKLKVDTINKNAASFRQYWGDQGASAGKYSSTVDAPYFTKSKHHKCDCMQRYSKTGNPTHSFLTPVANMVHQMPTHKSGAAGARGVITRHTKPKPAAPTTYTWTGTFKNPVPGWLFMTNPGPVQTTKYQGYNVAAPTTPAEAAAAVHDLSAADVQPSAGGPVAADWPVADLRSFSSTGPFLPPGLTPPINLGVPTRIGLAVNFTKINGVTFPAPPDPISLVSGALLQIKFPNLIPGSLKTEQISITLSGDNGGDPNWVFTFPNKSQNLFFGDNSIFVFDRDGSGSATNNNLIEAYREMREVDTVTITTTITYTYP